MSVNNPSVFGICFYAGKLKGTSLKMMMSALNLVPSEDQLSGSPEARKPRVFSPSIIHYNSPLLKLQLGSHYALWGTILAIAGHQGSTSCAEAIIYKIPSGERRKGVELAKCFLFCDGDYTIWGLNSTNHSDTTAS